MFTFSKNIFLSLTKNHHGLERRLANLANTHGMIDQKVPPAHGPRTADPNLKVCHLENQSFAARHSWMYLQPRNKAQCG